MSANPYLSPHDARILAMFHERKQAAMNVYGPFFQKVGRRYDHYRGFRRGAISANRNDINLNFLISIIQSDISRKTLALFGQKPWVDFEGTDPGACRRMSALISTQLEDADAFIKTADFVLQADMYGTGIIRDGWDTQRRLMRWRELDIETQKEVIRSKTVTKFNGPNFEVVDILDGWPQPGRGSRIEDCSWVMFRYRKDMDWAVVQGVLGTFDKEKVRLLESSPGMSANTQDEYTSRYGLYRSARDEIARGAERFDKPVTFVDMIGLVPDEFAKDGFNFRIMTVANDCVVVRDRPYDRWHGELPCYFYSPMRDPHYIHGIGKIEAAEKMSMMANRFANHKADAMDQALDQRFLVNRMAGINEENLISRPAQVIGVDGPVDESMIRALVPDFRMFSEAMNEIGMLDHHIQRVTGLAEDVGLGMKGASQDRSATAFAGRQEAMMTRQGIETRLLEEGWYEKMCNRWVIENSQFLPVGTEVSMLGQDAEVDPVTGIPVDLAKERQAITYDDLRGRYKGRAQGAQKMMSRFMQLDALTKIWPMITANPAAMQLVAWANTLRYTFKVAGLPNPNQFLVAQQIPAVNALAEQNGTSPENVVNGLPNLGGGNTEGLAEILASAMGNMGGSEGG